MMLCLVTQSCLALCDPMDCSPPGTSVQGESPDKRYWSGLPCSPPGDLPNPGFEPRFPVLQVDDYHCRMICRMIINIICWFLWLHYIYIMFFFREILDSQQNWDKSTEIFHISPCPTHEKSPQLITALTRVIHLLQSMNLHWNTIINKVYSLQYSSLLLLYIVCL